MGAPAPSMPALGRVPATWKTSPRAQVIADVSAALLLGCVLMTPSHTVGRRCLAYSADDVLEFECVDLRGLLMESLEVEQHALSAWETETIERQDWTAFGAAKAFVDAVGPRAAERALRTLHAAPGAVGVDPGPWKRPPLRECSVRCVCPRCTRRLGSSS